MLPPLTRRYCATALSGMPPWAVEVTGPQLAHTGHQYGQIRLHNFGLYVEQGLWGQSDGGR